MRNKICVVSAVMILFVCGHGYGGTMAGVGVRDAAAFGSIEKWSVGIDTEWMRRDITMSKGEIVGVEARTLEFFAGRDMSDWLTVFGTLGGAEFRQSGDTEYGDMNIKGSVGVQGNLWRTEIVDPEFMTGSLTFKSIVELSMYQLDLNNGQGEGHWLEFSLAFPVCYEIFTVRPDDIQKVPYSLALSLGPALSIVDGRADSSNGASEKFRERKLFGIYAGVDIYLSHNLSLGCHVEYEDHATIGGGIIYHF